MRKNKFGRRSKLLAAILFAGLLTVSLAASTGSIYADTQDSADTAAEEPAAALPVGSAARTVTEKGYLVLYPPAPPAVINPLTGLAGFNEKAVGKRPIALVVENDPKARPQWGIDDPEKSPDIILEGEMEGGETRTLWFYADMTALPSQAGPLRSARPPYIRFSELFDAIFIHCGYSHSSWDYTGADAVFSNDGVDHIDMLSYGNATGVFGRDYSRTSMLEHTAFLRGEKVADTIAATGFRTDANESRYTKFEFEGTEEETKEEPKTGTGLVDRLRQASDLIVNPPAPEEPAGKPCTSIDIQFSNATDTKHFDYSEEDKMYHTQDYYTDVARTNVLLLFDETRYIEKQDTWGAGVSELYCNYEFAGGRGYLARNGRIEEITWAVEDGRIALRGADGEPAQLTPGKTWIGWCSENHRGSVTAE
ncbi:MAG: DUF3048 domain-containing protein [Clostridiales bacterium]|nr:DUF3048 domain-containing protein [Clostridiales bacterium]